MELAELLPGVEKNVPLAPFTTFRIGGRARYLFRAKNTEDVKRAQSAARQIHLPFFVLAGGSNVLISDKGFSGLVVLMENTQWSIKGIRLEAEAGVPFATVVSETQKGGLSGLEWAGGLPGSVGGAVRGNAGAFGGEVKDTVLQVEILDEKGEVRTLLNKECEFGYRTSIFKKTNWIVLSVVFELKQGDAEEIARVAESNIQYRTTRHPLEYPTAGSMFKNCDVKNVPLEVQEKFKGIIKKDPFPILPTAALIAGAGLQGMRIGGAQVSEKHPNYIVNLGNATAENVLRLTQNVKEGIKEKYGVELEEEVQYIE